MENEQSQSKYDAKGRRFVENVERGEAYMTERWGILEIRPEAGWRAGGGKRWVEQSRKAH